MPAALPTLLLSQPTRTKGQSSPKSPTVREVTVCDMNGEEWQLELDVKWSVFKAKSIIAKASGFPAKELQLVCEARLLHEDEKLFDVIVEERGSKADARVSLVRTIAEQVAQANFQRSGNLAIARAKLMSKVTYFV